MSKKEEKQKVSTWGYKTLVEKTITIRPRTFKDVRNNRGHVIDSRPVPAIQLNFDNCHCFIHPKDYKKYQLDSIEDLIQIIDGHEKFGIWFWKFQSPDKPASAEDKKAAESAPRKPKVIHGTRNLD